jgi:5,10-methylenetetrahydrofolate reductase
MPNAGEPRYVDDRLMYLATPEYFGEYAKRFLQAGVRIIGGCCGTTPAHIEAIRKSVIQHQPSAARTTKVTVLPAAERVTTVEPVPTARKSPLATKMGIKFVVSVELDPPKGVDPSKVIEGARACRAAGVDAINIADGPRAIARMSPLAMAVMIRDQVGGIETIIHYCCRDRNVLGMQADMIGANALGLRNMIIITGDPPKLGNYPFATGVFDVDAIGAVRLASNLNHGIDLAGNPIAGATALYLGVGADPSSPTFEREVERFHQKVEAGAEFVMTQPVYDLRQLERFLEATADCRIPVLVGILPLASYKNAEFLNNEVPGIIIPEAVMKRMARHSAGEQAKKEGIAIAKETLREARSMVQGTYIMPPFNRYEVALQILEAS